MEHSFVWPYAIAIPNHSAQTVAREIIKYFTLFGIFGTILTNLRTELKSVVF